MTAPIERAHASLGASGAHRWMNCPGSPRLIEQIGERRSSIYVDEGTAAHLLAERCLSCNHDAKVFLGRIVNIKSDAHGTQFLAKGSPISDGMFEVDKEMVEAVQLFLDEVRAAIEEGDTLVVEHRINLGDDMFGTADAIVIKKRACRLKVFDLKYGAGVAVEVKDNPQLIYYGEGAFREVGDALDWFTGMDITIVQPRCPHPDGPVRSVEIDPLQLLDWSLTIAQAADATRAPDAPLVPWTPESGVSDWCRWCPAAGGCPARASRALAVAQEDFDDLDALPEIALPTPELLSPRQIAKILDGAELLTTWLESVRQFAYSEAENGRPIPGYKLVDKVPRRHWSDEDAAAHEVRAMGLDREQIYTEPKLKSPAQIEKLVGKKDFAAKLAKLAPAVSSGTTLAPESDKRPAVVRSIESEFDNIDEEVIDVFAP
jgi:hypothetical protein